MGISINKSVGLLLVLILASSTTVTFFPVHVVSSGDDWPMFNHDPAHTSYSTSSVPSNPVLIWTFPSPDITYVPQNNNHVVSAPTIADGYLYIDGANGGGFYCLNASTGTPVWTRGISGSPAVYNGYVYGSAVGLIAALNASTGTKIWQTNYTNVYGNPESGGAPTVADGVVYVSSNDRYLYAFNASTGAQLWEYLTISPSDYYATFNQMYASPAVANGNIYIGTNEGNVLAFGNASTAISTPPPNGTPPKPFPTVEAFVLAFVLIAGAGLLIYFKKRNSSGERSRKERHYN